LDFKKNSKKSVLLIIFLVICLVISGSFIVFNSHIVLNASAGSGEPPENGTTTTTWYVDGKSVRENEWINTSDIQINDTGSMDWINITAEVNGNITVSNMGYFNLTNCSLILNGNLTINGTVTFRNVSLKMNSTFDGEFNIEVFGSLYIYDLDKDDTSTKDASVINAVNADYEYLFWIRSGAFFKMQYSELHECGWNAKYQGLNIATNDTIIENNIISNNYIGIYYNHSSNNILANNTFELNTYAGVTISYGTNNNIGFNKANNNAKGISMEYTADNMIFDNTITDSFQDGIELFASTYNTIEHNTISNSQDDGIDIDSSSDFNRILNNTISLNGFGTVLTNADNNTIFNNSYTNNVNSSVVVYLLSTNNRIIKNSCTGTQVGIGSLAAHKNSYHNNKMSSNLMGLALSNSRENNITHNNVTSNTLVGIALNSSSANNEIHYNNITGHFLNGIYVEDAASLVNATYNWWGSWSGPKHATTNPAGKGDTVTDYVIYRPWGLFNVQPTIDVEDKKTAIEDIYYEHVYLASDLNGDIITWHQADNASWLNWNSTNRKLYGTPNNSAVGSYWVRINISDNAGGYDEHNFTLNVTNIAPNIITSNIISATEDVYYFNDYNSTDDYSGTITWSLETNTSWLQINGNTGVLNGTPDNADVGLSWVNVSVSDGHGGMNFTNFTIDVTNVNDPPEIIPIEIEDAEEDLSFSLHFEATDIDPTKDTLTWSLLSNAKWLEINSSSGALVGTPNNYDVGDYWVNVSVADGNSGKDWVNFTISVINVNDNPNITTVDDEIVRFDELYFTDYEAEDIDPTNDTLIWFLNTNASWLVIDSVTGVLSGTPTRSDEGTYWVNVTVSDGQGGFDWHNFTLSVIPGELEPNANPIITTQNVITAEVGKIYSVAYAASDDRTPVANLTWHMRTDATWLEFDEATIVLSGTPLEADAGYYWVNITVSDGEGGLTFTNFTIEVTKPVIENKKPKLTEGKITPGAGDTETKFTFTVIYSDEDNDSGEVWVWIDGEKFQMSPAPNNNDFTDGVLYTYETKLGKGEHTYYFTATDGINGAEPGDTKTPTNEETALKTPVIKEVEKDDDGEDNLILYSAIIIAIIIIIALLAFAITRSKKGEEEKLEEIEEAKEQELIDQETQVEPEEAMQE